MGNVCQGRCGGPSEEGAYAIASKKDKIKLLVPISDPD